MMRVIGRLCCMIGAHQWRTVYVNPVFGNTEEICTHPGCRKLMNDCGGVGFAVTRRADDDLREVEI